MTSPVKQELIALLPRLRRFARSLTRSATEADDLVQEACLRAIAHAAKWDPAQPFDRWVFRVMRNLWISELRKRSVRLGEGLVAAEDAPELTSPATGEAALALGEARGHLAALPPDLAQILLAVSVEGYSYAEAAQMFELPVGTVMSRLYRARRALAKRIAESEVHPDVD